MVKPRHTDVVTPTPGEFRWLLRMVAQTGCAVLVDGAFEVVDEARWRQLLQAAGGKET